jgi:hypothetical protein
MQSSVPTMDLRWVDQRESRRVDDALDTAGARTHHVDLYAADVPALGTRHRGEKRVRTHDVPPSRRITMSPFRWE